MTLFTGSMVNLMHVKPLENIKYIKTDMENKGWVISSFLFTYKAQKYVVLVELYSKEEIKPDYALLKLHFLKENNFDDDLETPANSYSLMTDAKRLREYFGIAYSDNLGDILRQFSEKLGKYIPRKFELPKTDLERKAMVHSLGCKESNEPDKIYCYDVRRNGHKMDGTPKKRSPYNDNKTRLLRPILYKRFYKDNTLSFCYSDKQIDEKSDDDITLNFTKRNLN